MLPLRVVRRHRDVPRVRKLALVELRPRVRKLNHVVPRLPEPRLAALPLLVVRLRLAALPLLVVRLRRAALRVRNLHLVVLRPRVRKLNHAALRPPEWPPVVPRPRAAKRLLAVRQRPRQARVAPQLPRVHRPVAPALPNLLLGPRLRRSSPVRADPALRHRSLEA
ncbi:MAG: hypothetical protein V3W41_05310 [Planctomycetota bacterium]